MSDSTVEQSIPPQPIKNLELGIWGEIKGIQRGRVTQLTHPEFGTTWLIDVTDQQDPTTGENKTIGELMQEDLSDPTYNDIYNYNNGLVAAVTDRIDPEERRRIYLGMKMSNPDDPKHKEITMHILAEAGLFSGSLYVPLSFDSSDAMIHIYREIMSAVTETGDKKLISQFQAAGTRFLPEPEDAV